VLSWNKILPSLSQASTIHHPNVFTPILSLSEGRAGIAWVPSNKMLFFPLRHKVLLAFPQMFSIFFYSYTILSDSFSLFQVASACFTCSLLDFKLVKIRLQRVKQHCTILYLVSLDIIHRPSFLNKTQRCPVMEISCV
jgi:hypothetical protein